jgi:hypothetical protein
MGLDNGLIIKPKTERAYNFLKKNFPHLQQNSYYYEFYWEFCYYRKCWNIRSRFFEFNYAQDEDEQKLAISDLPVVLNKIIKYFLIEDNWDNNDSIWSYNEIKPSLKRQVHDIQKFLDLLEKETEKFSEDDFEIFFYDSY